MMIELPLINFTCSKWFYRFILYCLCCLGFVQELIFWIVHWTVFYDSCNTGLQIFSMESLSTDSSTHFSLPHYKLLFRWNPISYNMVHAISLSQRGTKKKMAWTFLAFLKSTCIIPKCYILNENWLFFKNN